MHKILVIDDDVDILTLVKMTLSMHGYNVAILSNWEHIDDTIVSYEPDLILLDVSLGGADGREICRRLKSDKATQHIPIILFSANIEIEKNTGDCNAQGFISKPYELKSFLNTIRTTIEAGKGNPHSG